MKQFKTVFHFELMNYLKRKSYIAVTIVLMAVVAAILLVPLAMGGTADVGQQETVAEENTEILLLDETGGALEYLNGVFADSGYTFVSAGEDVAQMKAQVDEGAYEFAVVVTGPLSYTRYVQTITMYDMFDAQLSEALLQKYKEDTLLSLGVPQQELEKLDTATVTQDVQITASGKDQSQSYWYTYILIMVLYMVIIIYGQFVSSSVAAEKSTRAMELLITSANPKSLIFGKVLGTGSAGLLQFALVLGTAFAIFNANAEAYAAVPMLQAFFGMPLSLFLYTILFFVLGFYIYAFLFAAMGSLVSRMEDLGTATQPILWLFIVAFVVVMFSMGSGEMNNPVIVACSFIPFTSPMAMFSRIALGNVAPWEIIVSVAILVVSAVLIGMLATGIYRLGVLLYGNPPKPKEIIRMLKNSKA
ncbi:ABC transporter permease [Christensenellaceae bacterium OttesenSCG-928-K19]|nr:ABC transporter permease [Christensenellaceae bacterium OttesenSCG-928-K19]